MIAELFTIENGVTLFMLVLLQAVLGFDNLLYISLESKQAPASQQRTVRQWGIGIAVILRIILLFLIMSVIEKFQSELFGIRLTGIVEGGFNLHAIVVLFGGAFILYTAIKEIWHMMLGELEHGERKPKSAFTVVFWIVLMNVVFSFDSILSAMALTSDIEHKTVAFVIMATAILIGGILMIVLADGVSAFLAKNRMYEILGLFVLFIVGVMLVTEGGHLAQVKLFGNEVHAMTKTTFYFVIAVLLLMVVAQSRYQKKLLAQKHQSVTLGNPL
ncbi:MAG: tellurium resistance protein TerC [Gammaproteobacteria bacterium]|nr:MAG: tellurium resistance protein TerC [Gammaproteobacteria bacterium]